MSKNPFITLAQVSDQLYEKAVLVHCYRARPDQEEIWELERSWKRAAIEARWSAHRLSASPDPVLQKCNQMVEYLAYVIKRGGRAEYDAIDRLFPDSMAMTERLWEMADYWAGAYGQPIPERPPDIFESADTRKKSKPGPRARQPGEDSRIWGMWESGGFTTYAALAQELKVPTDQVARAVDRFRKRKVRS